MKLNRIFIENLPETVTESEIKSKFAEFGEVITIEIKERKVVTTKNSSCFFAYISLKTSDSQLQKCFQTFSTTPWCGEYVQIKIAKESFLERLKRERESNSHTSEPQSISNEILTDTSKEITSNCSVKPTAEKVVFEAPVRIPERSEANKRVKRKKKVSTSSSDSSNEEENNVETKKNISLSENENKKTNDDSENEIQIQKPKRGAQFVNGLLKIEQFDTTKIIDDNSKNNEKILDKQQVEAEVRRKNAVMEKIKAYRLQKNAFNQFQKKPKIIRFNDDDDVEQNNESHKSKKMSSNKLTLFQNSDSETDDLNIEKNIENRIKSDQRFELDERFLEDENDEMPSDPEEIDLMKEKQKESEILEEILGKKIKFNSQNRQASDQNGSKFIRYDPSNPVHSECKIEGEQNKQTNTKKKKKTNEKKVEAKEAPEVSKERLHSVKVDLKAALGQSGGFSLSEIIGEAKEEENKSMDEEETPLPLPAFSLTNKNPYKFDSSDDEDETEHLKEKEKLPLPQKPRKVWTEPLFLQENDFRYQEGLDFVKRIATQERKEGEFENSRKEFKQIIRNKIRNAKKKNKPFQRKLGGSKKKKMKRMDKALKR